MLEGYFRYWGKARGREGSGPECHLLPYHCLDVAAAGNVLLRQMPELTSNLAAFLGADFDSLQRWICFLLAIHDMGKFADGFQNMRPDLVESMQGRSTTACYSERHDALGYRLVAGTQMQPGVAIQLLSRRQKTSTDPADLWDLLAPWLSAALGHHGRPPILSINSQPLSMQIPPVVSRDVQSFLRDATELFFPERLPPDLSDYSQCEAFRRASWLLAGVAVTADWIGSNEAWFGYVAESMPLCEYWRDRALPQAGKAIAESGLLAATPAPWGGILGLFPKIESPTPLQHLVERIELSQYPQLFIFEEVTGGGKTEAAVALAHRLMDRKAADGIYFALPTMATANAMHSRIREVYQRLFAKGSTPSLVLAHSARRMVLDLEKNLSKHQCPPPYGESATLQSSEWLSDSRKKALLAHVGVGTIDQALLAVLAARHQSMRLFGLCRKVLIVDEVHACDSYVHQLLCTLLRFHAALGGTAVLLSATLPVQMRQELVQSYADVLGANSAKAIRDSYPLVTHLKFEGLAEHAVAARDSAQRRVSVRPLRSSDEVSTILTEALEGGRCACWVRNTVDDALDAYRCWTARLGPDRVMLFHARFALVDRLRIESEVLRVFGPESGAQERTGRLLMATQVVEQSLDLDFDELVSDLAPIDLLIQRAGRMKRHSRNGNGDRIDGPDGRAAPELSVFLPEPVADADGNWYAGLFPKAAYVYSNHGQLWLTARWLCDRLAFSMPEDARDMIEGVYGETGQSRIPNALEISTQSAEGQLNAMAAQGRLNSLKLEEGYLATTTHWQDDAYAPTRLGEPTVTVRLARREGDRLVPWAHGDPRHAWQLSQLTIRQSKIAGDSPGISEGLLSAGRESMPDKGKYCVIIPLERDGDAWLGNAVNGHGEVVRLMYDECFGLQFLGGDAA